MSKQCGCRRRLQPRPTIRGQLQGPKERRRRRSTRSLEKKAPQVRETRGCTNRIVSYQHEASTAHRGQKRAVRSALNTSPAQQPCPCPQEEHRRQDQDREGHAQRAPQKVNQGQEAEEGIVRDVLPNPAHCWREDRKRTAVLLHRLG